MPMIGRRDAPNIGATGDPDAEALVPSAATVRGSPSQLVVGAPTWT